MTINCVTHAHQNLKNFKESAAAYEVASVLKGADASETLFRLGLVRLDHLKDFEAAARNFHDFQEKYKLGSRRQEATFNEALCYYQSYYIGKKEHLKKAIKLFEEFVKANGRHELADVAQYYAGKLKHIDEDWTGAIKALEPLVGSKNPVLDQLVFLLGDSYHQLEQWDNSAKFYMLFARGNEKALNADVALHNAGLAYSKLKKPDTEKAIFAYKLLEGKCPESPHLSSARLKLGIIHYEAEEYDEAKTG